MVFTLSRLAAVALLALAAVVAAQPAEAGKRVALIIGNSAYQVGPLANPGRDAAAVARAFERLGFDTVISRTNLAAQSMKAALAEIARAASGAEIAVVYYAGHGTEREGRNYLIPVDARLERASDLELQAIALPTVIDQIAGATKLRLVILDACRNNVFPLAGAKRATTRGLARIEPDNNTLVVYAAKEGTTADDGSGGANSPFTKAFLAHVATPGLEVNFVFRRIRDDVMKATGGAQQPHTYGTLGGEAIYLRPDPAPSDPAPSGAAPGAQAMLEPSKPEMEAATPAMDTKAQIVAIQEGLKRAGCFFADSTGTWGPKTRAAVAAFNEHSDAKIAAEGPTADSVALMETTTGRICPADVVRPPGERFRDCDDCPEMVVIPEGKFYMGLQEGDEFVVQTLPITEVSIGKSFAVGRFHVKRGEFRAFVEASGHVVSGNCETVHEGPPIPEGNWSSPGFEQDDSHPVVCISWQDAEAYVGWLSEKSGKRYRLMSESEAEYVARGSQGSRGKPDQDRTRFFFGSDYAEVCGYFNTADQTTRGNSQAFALVPDSAKMDERGEWASCSDGYAFTAPGGSFKANPFGLFDVQGNVFSWVEDCWNPGYEGAPTDGSAWVAGDCGLRMMRGGSWAQPPRAQHASWRVPAQIDKRMLLTGLRVARSLEK